MFSSAKFFAFLLFIVEAKFLYETDESTSVYVNNMRTEPTYLTADIDMYEYQYVDGDVVNIRCGEYDTLYDNIMMEYPMADTLRDLFNTTLPTGNFVGFVSKLYSGHNNSYVICHNEDTGFKIIVRFILQKESALLSINIDGMTIRQKKKPVKDNTYLIDYQHLSSIDNEAIKVHCEVEKEDLQLMVMDSFVNNLTDYQRKELIKSKKSEICFVPSAASYKLQCLARDVSGETSEKVVIRVTRYIYFMANFPLHLEMSTRGKMMELYSVNKYYGVKVVFYEFEVGEVLQLNCSVPKWDNEHYLKSDDSETCDEDGCTINKQLNLTESEDNTKFACYYMERRDTINGTATNTSENDLLVAEFRVLFSLRSTTSLTALILSNMTRSNFWLLYEKMNAVTPGSVAEDTDHTTTIIVSVVSAVVVLCGLGFLIFWLCRRYYEKNLKKRIAANMAPPFYLNLILRRDCDNRIAELDQHVYEEIGPPIYDVIDNSALKEIDYTVHKKNSPVGGESDAGVSEETRALVHKNRDAPVHEEIEALVHRDGDTSAQEEFYAPVHQGIDASEHKGIDEPVSKVTARHE